MLRKDRGGRGGIDNVQSGKNHPLERRSGNPKQKSLLGGGNTQKRGAIRGGDGVMFQQQPNFPCKCTGDESRQKRASWEHETACNFLSVALGWT